MLVSCRNRSSSGRPGACEPLSTTAWLPSDCLAVSEPMNWTRAYTPLAPRETANMATISHRCSLAAWPVSRAGPGCDAVVPAPAGGPVTGGPVTGGPVTGGPVTGGPVTGGPVTGGAAVGTMSSCELVGVSVPDGPFRPRPVPDRPPPG